MKIGDLAREAPFVTRVTERPGIVVDRVHDVHGSIRVYLYASKVGDFRFLEEADHPSGSPGGQHGREVLMAWESGERLGGADYGLHCYNCGRRISLANPQRVGFCARCEMVAPEKEEAVDHLRRMAEVDRAMEEFRRPVREAEEREDRWRNK
jgi:hypothetical protein